MIKDTVIYQAYTDCDLNNYWTKTPYEIYFTIGAKSKGTVGETIVKNYLESVGFIIKPRENAGHDAIVNGIKTEIKFSLASKRNLNNEYTFNHIGVNKDWERIIFCGINGNLQEKIVWFTNEEIQKILAESNSCFRFQEGDDDFFSMGKNSTNLLNHSFAKNIMEW